MLRGLDLAAYIVCQRSRGEFTIGHGADWIEDYKVIKIRFRRVEFGGLKSTPLASEFPCASRQHALFFDSTRRMIGSLPASLDPQTTTPSYYQHFSAYPFCLSILFCLSKL